MANGFIVGVSPIHGLYAAIAGPLVGGLCASTQLMMITTTAAASLTAGQALAGVGGRLYLSGVHADVAAQLRRAGKLDGDVEMVFASEVLGESTERAMASASEWLGGASAAGFGDRSPPVSST
jgi:hypothetical protein